MRCSHERDLSKRKLRAIQLAVVALVVSLSGVGAAHLYAGKYQISFSATECRELHTYLGEADGFGEYDHNSIYLGSDTDFPMRLFCPVNYVQRLDIGRHRWSWGPGEGMIASVRVSVFDNNPGQDARCRLHASDWLDWDQDGYADWESSEWESTQGTGLHHLNINIGMQSPPDSDLFRKRGGFLALYCEVPPKGSGHDDIASKIGGYTLTMERSKGHAY